MVEEYRPGIYYISKKEHLAEISDELVERALLEG